ncbi:MAG: O-methyltransferase [Nitrososphaera sp.]
MNKKILRVLSTLGRESDRQLKGKSHPPPGREMIAITRDTGVFLSLLLRAIRAKSVLEIGTSSGYSSLWFADALPSTAIKGRRPSIVTIESNPDKVKWARANFRKAGVESMVRVIEGDAIKVLRRLSTGKKFDFVFIDADKENIIRYFELVLPMVRVGGIVAADNMLLPQHFRPHMKKYASYLSRRTGVQTVTVPIGMGEEITLKLR